MATQGLDFFTALSNVRSQRPSIFPNSGFTEQLKLFKEMNCRIDYKHEKYISYMKDKGLSHLVINFFIMMMLVDIF